MWVARSSAIAIQPPPRPCWWPRSPDQSRVVFEHLLEMRDAPVLRRRVAEETTRDLVVRPAACHALQRVLGHAAQLGVRPQNGLFEQQQDRVGLGKLRRAAEPSVLLV